MKSDKKLSVENIAKTKIQKMRQKYFFIKKYKCIAHINHGPRAFSRFLMENVLSLTNVSLSQSEKNSWN